jgi:hypothetical protein
MATVTESSLREWEILSGSPVLRASTPSNGSSVAYPRCASVSSMELDDDEHEHEEHSMQRSPCDCDSLVDVFDLVDDFVLMCFERLGGSKTMIAPNRKRIQNWNPVVPVLIKAQCVAWSPLVDNKGRGGHRFTLFNHGVEEAKVEVFASNSELVKIVFVHTFHSRLAYHAGAVGAFSILKFATPRQHIEKLRAVVNNASTMYLPLKEVVANPALHSLELSCENGYNGHPMAPIAPLIWDETKKALNQISDLTRRHIDNHNQAEFLRVGLVR